MIVDELRKELVLDADTPLAVLKKNKGELRNIVAAGFLHRRVNLADWINSAHDLLGPHGTLWIVVPYGATAWSDPFAVRECNETTFTAWDSKGENFKTGCKPFQACIWSMTGNDLHVRLIK